MRVFGTQLLCEQVISRALRCVSYTSNAARMFDAEYAEVATARSLWVPAVNHHGAFGRWAFLELVGPWNAAHAIHATLVGETQQAHGYMFPFNQISQ